MSFDNFTASPPPAVPVTSFDYAIEVLAYVFNTYYTPLLVFLGCIGNIISLYVFYASKLRMQSTSLYLSVLAISDTVFLLQLLPPWFKSMQITNLFYKSGFCQVFVYSTYSSCTLSVWLVVAFTIERFVAVLYPLRRNSMCTVTRAKAVIAVLVLVSMVINLPVIKYALPSRKGCNIGSKYMAAAARFNLADTVVSFSLPLGLIVLLNISITCRLWRRECERRRMMPTALAVSPPLCERPPLRALPPLRSQQRVTRMLLTVSTVFVVLNLPAYTMRLLAYAYGMSAGEYTGRWAALQQLALMFFNTNFGINFILYCLAGQNFRRELCQSMPCLRQRARPADDMQLVCRNDDRAGSVTSGVVYGVQQPDWRRFSDDAPFAGGAMYGEQQPGRRRFSDDPPFAGGAMYGVQQPGRRRFRDDASFAGGVVYGVQQPGRRRFRDEAQFAGGAMYNVLQPGQRCFSAAPFAASYVSVGEASTSACALCAEATSRARRQHSEPFIERWTFVNSRAIRNLTLPTSTHVLATTNARPGSDEIEMQELAPAVPEFAPAISMLDDARPGEEDMKRPSTPDLFPLVRLNAPRNRSPSSEYDGGGPSNNN